MSQELIRGLWRIFYADTFRNRGFQDQIMRSAISIANNVAEWNERWSDRDFVKFLYYAKWSAGEVRSMLYSAQDFKYITNEQFILFADQCIRISTKINNFITSLKK
jgi:four helix bundle protein